MDHRLFAINIFAGLHRIHRNLLVPMVGGADDDGVDIFALQDLGVVAGGKEIVAPEFLAVLEPAVVTIRHGNELHPRNLQRNLGISLALAAGADQCDLNMIIRRYRVGRFGLSLTQQMRSGPEQRLHRCRRPCRLKKTSTIQIEHSRPHTGKLSAVCNHTAFMAGKARLADQIKVQIELGERRQAGERARLAEIT